MTVQLKKPAAGAVALHAVTRADLAEHLKAAPAATQRWLQATGFSAAPDSQALVPDADGNLREVWVGVRSASHPYALAALPRSLPVGRYRLADEGLAIDAEAAALSWELGSYQFDLYKPAMRESASLMLPSSRAAQRGLMMAAAIASTRDLVNTPAEHMGPA